MFYALARACWVAQATPTYFIVGVHRMLEVEELALIQRQCERAHIEHPRAAMAMLLWPERNPDFIFPECAPFDRTDGHVVNQYDHSQGYVQVHFFGSDEALALYEHIARAACRAMPNKRVTDSWAEFLFELRMFSGRPFPDIVDDHVCVVLRENPFLASALVIQTLLPPPVIDSEQLRRRSLEAMRQKFEAAAERSPKAKHYIVISDKQLKGDRGEYMFKTPEGRWWRCKAENLNITEFSTLCREAAHIIEDDPRCALMPKPGGLALGHDDAWMMFVHRLAWREPSGSALRAFTEKEGSSAMPASTAQSEPVGLLSELRQNVYGACASAIDVILAMPAARPASPAQKTAQTVQSLSDFDPNDVKRVRDAIQNLGGEPKTQAVVDAVKPMKRQTCLDIRRLVLQERNDAGSRNQGN
jgi:hypothetical protein